MYTAFIAGSWRAVAARRGYGVGVGGLEVAWQRHKTYTRRDAGCCSRSSAQSSAAHVALGTERTLRGGVGRPGRRPR